jgi:hypothetical protein
MFLLPPIASVVPFAFLWREDLLPGLMWWEDASSLAWQDNSLRRFIRWPGSLRRCECGSGDLPGDPT